MLKAANISIKATNRGRPAMKGFQKGLDGIRTSQARATRVNKSFAKGMSANRRIIQNVGFQLSDLGVQIAGGQSAILSLTQNVPQVVQMFGAWGAILASIITLVGTLTLVMVKSGKSFADLAPMFGVAREELEAFGRAVGRVKELVFDGINLIINNFDQLLITLSVVAAFMVGKWIAAFVASSGILRVFNLTLVATRRHGLAAGAAMFWTRGAVVALSKAFTILSKVIIRTGIGALIIGLGYLIERLFTLNSVTKDWGVTFALVGRVIKQTLLQIPAFFTILQVKWAQMNASMAASWLEFLAGISAGLSGRVNFIIRQFVNAGQAIGAVWQGLKGSIKNIMIDVAQSVVDRVKDAVQKVINIAERFPGITIPVDLDGLGEIKGKVEFTLKDVNGMISKIVKDNALKDFVGADGAITKAITDKAQQVRRQAEALGLTAGTLLKNAKAAIPAYQELLDLLGKAGVKDFDIRNLLGKGGGDDKKKDDLTKRLEKAQANAQKAIAVIGQTFSNSNIAFHIDTLKRQISSLSTLPPPKLDAVLNGVDLIAGRIQNLAGPIQAEKAKLQKILDGDLLKVNPDKFFKDTLEITTRLQELTRPITAEIEKIKALDPSLKELDTKAFSQSLIKAISEGRTTMNQLREILGQKLNITPVEIPALDMTAPNASIRETNSLIMQLGNSVEQGLKSNFKELIKGTQSLKKTLSNILGSIADSLASFAIDSLFQKVLGSAGGASGNGGLGSFFQSVFSFNGGGFTGKGARSGGVDGKGGFPAILHPNETVVDHTKTLNNPNKGDLSNLAMGYNSGSSAPPVVITTHNYFNGVTREEVMRDVETSQRQLKKEIVDQMPGEIKKTQFNQRRGVA